MENVQRFTFDRSRMPERLDRFLAEALPELSRSQLKRLIDEGQVTLNNAAVKASTKLKGGEEIAITLPEAVPTETLSQDIPLTVLYEDSQLIVIDKPAGMVVHPAPGHSQGTLVNALLYHCQDLSGIGGELRPGIVHRLDKDTSGVMVATKTDEAHQHLAQQFKDHSINRRYVALVHGLLPSTKGTVDKPIGRHPTQRKKMSTGSRNGRQAVTHWKVLQAFEEDRLSLVELRLETGRTHQIRVHLADMLHPVLADPVYGGNRIKTLKDPELRRLATKLGRQALHARLLGFIHPVSGEYLDSSSAVPADMQSIIDYLQNKYLAASAV
ncbi:MAG: RluA family pseudouridine synthase [Desulfuromonadaceae bacterium]|nr:RluA family pseudouridine synthase [Desulfuromonadaceae bacterium]